jgi:hypothetical protein
VKRRGRRSLLIALVALAAAPSAAVAVTETQALGNVTAQLTYEKSKFGFFKNVRESIFRDGVSMVDQAAPSSPSCAECPAVPAFGGRGKAVAVSQLDATPDPEVIFDLFSGGLHCCFYSQIFSFQGGAYRSLVHDWGDPGYTLFDPDKDGTPEFRSGDPAFAYAFGSFASTRFPPQIWRFSNGVLLDVTRQFPALIQSDARRLKRQFKKLHHLGVKPLLAAFVADRCLLGSCERGFELVAKAKRKGWLSRAAKFEHRLRGFLAKSGYMPV